jgi:hypothetical protein
MSIGAACLVSERFKDAISSIFNGSKHENEPPLYVTTRNRSGNNFDNHLWAFQLMSERLPNFYKSFTPLVMNIRVV